MGGENEGGDVRWVAGVTQGGELHQKKQHRDWFHEAFVRYKVSYAYILFT